MTDTLELDNMDGVLIYEIVEKLLAIGQLEKVVTMATEDGDIAIYNTGEGKIRYVGYIDIKSSEFIEAEPDEKTDD